MTGVLLVLLCALLAPGAASAETAATLYAKHCAVCRGPIS